MCLYSAGVRVAGVGSGVVVGVVLGCCSVVSGVAGVLLLFCVVAPWFLRVEPL